VTRINQRLATCINPYPKNHGQTEDKELDAPLHRPDRRTKRALEIHQHQNGSEEDSCIDYFAGSTKTDP